MEHKLQVKSVTHSFGKKSILSQCALACKTGEVIGILGRNGSGKSTLFKILFGTLKPDHFEAYLDDQAWLRNTGVTIVGYHPQEVMLPKRLKVRSLISMYIADPERQNNVFYAKGIDGMLNKDVGILSLGQQRYLQLVLLLNLNHQFLLLDEPFSMVEPLYRELVKEKLIEYKSSKGFIITDHYYLDVLEIANKINLIKNGQITAIDNIDELRTLEYLSEQSIIY